MLNVITIVIIMIIILWQQRRDDASGDSAVMLEHAKHDLMRAGGGVSSR